MRGTDEAAGSLFSYVDLEERVPARHPLRLIRRIVNDALASLDAEFGPDRPPRPRQGSRAVHDDHGGVQSGQAPEAPGGLTDGAAQDRARRPAFKPSRQRQRSSSPTSSAPC